jgi:hypothetical protein
MTEITSASDARLQSLPTLMDEAARGSSFRELDPFGERHGIWERTLHQYSAQLDRYVSVGLTNLDAHDEVVVIAGAEERLAADEKRQPRRRRFDMGTLRLTSENSQEWPREDLLKLLNTAVRMALEIEGVQLEEAGQLAS